MQHLIRVSTICKWFSHFLKEYLYHSLAYLKLNLYSSNILCGGVHSVYNGLKLVFISSRTSQFDHLMICLIQCSPWSECSFSNVIGVYIVAEVWMNVWMLAPKVQSRFVADILNFLFFWYSVLSEKIILGLPSARIHMKCQALFNLKKKKKKWYLLHLW